MRLISALLLCGALVAPAHAENKNLIELPINWKFHGPQIFCLHLNSVNGDEYSLYHEVESNKTKFKSSVPPEDPRWIKTVECIADPDKFLNDLIEVEVQKRITPAAAPPSN